MGFEYSDDAEGGLPVPDRIGAELINIAQRNIGVTPRNQPVEKLDGEAQVAVDLGALEQAKCFARIVLCENNSASHELLSDCAGSGILDQRQHGGKPGCVFGQLVGETDDRFERAAVADLSFYVVREGAPDLRGADVQPQDTGASTLRVFVASGNFRWRISWRRRSYSISLVLVSGACSR